MTKHRVKEHLNKEEKKEPLINEEGSTTKIIDVAQKDSQGQVEDVENDNFLDVISEY